MEDNFSQFTGSVSVGDLNKANKALMRELANILVKNRGEFVHLLKESNLNASESMTDSELIKMFIDNVAINKELTLGASFLVSAINKQNGFDGEEISDNAVKSGYYVMNSYFTGDNSFDNYSNVVGAIAGAVGGLSNLGTTLAQGRQKKKYGVFEMAAKKQEAQAEMAKQAAETRKLQLEALNKKKEQAAKTTRTILIVTSVVVGIGLIGGIIYALKNK